MTYQIADQRNTFMGLDNIKSVAIPSTGADCIKFGCRRMMWRGSGANVR